MWKDRTFLFGCAIGVWASCILAGGLYLVQGNKQDGNIANSQDSSIVPITDTQLRTLASERHLVVQTEQDYSKSQKQIKTLSDQLAQLKQTGGSGVNQAGQFVFVTIQPGLSLSETADLLNKAGVIKDPASFVKDASNVPSFIKAGTYRFPTHADNQTILDLITK